MNDLSKTPAAELVGEWNQKSWVESKSTNHQDWRERRQLIAQELDRRCEAAGMAIVDGSFVYEKEFKGRIMNLVSSVPFKHYTKIPASEQHALGGWLLMKEGK